METEPIRNSGKRSRIRTFLLSIFVALVFAAGMAGGVVLDRGVLAGYAADPTIPANATKNFSLMAEAWNTIQKVYVDRKAVDATRLTYGAINGMITALGDTGHSTFLSPQMLKDQHILTSGEFEGIGAQVEMKNGNLTIVAPYDGSPAQKAGLRPGDIILKVDGLDITGMPIDEAVGHVLGPAGTKVTLTIQDPNTNSVREVTITRARIMIHNVTWDMIPGTKIAHIRLAGFSQGVTDELKVAIQQAQQQGATGIVFDLRNDPGGLLGEAVGVTSQFLKDGNVLLEKDAQGNVTSDQVKPGGIATDIPMVVLINGGTASAAEITSGAIQDAGRAKLIGETTFGTGTVLNTFPLSDGSALLLATEEWLTPKGRVIWHQGIAPDQKITLPANQEILTPDGERGMTASAVLSSGDAQLLKALELLNGSAAK